MSSNFIILFSSSTPPHPDLLKSLAEAAGRIESDTEASRIVLLPESIPHESSLDGWEIWKQPSGDLVQMLSAAMARAFEEGGQKVIMADIGHLTLSATDIGTAFQRLNSVDVVLGVLNDGGLYLVGARRMIPELFPDTDWYADNLLELTLKSLCTAGVSLRLLEEK